MKIFATWLFVGLVSVGCGRLDCLTSDGVFVVADDEVLKLHSCEDWEKSTKQYIRDFSEYAQALHYALPANAVASALYGTTVNVRNGSFVYKGVICSGLAHLGSKEIDLGLHPEMCKNHPKDVSCELCDPMYSAYFHELSHVVMCWGYGRCASWEETLNDHPLVLFENSYFNTCGKLEER